MTNWNDSDEIVELGKSLEQTVGATIVRPPLGALAGVCIGVIYSYALPTLLRDTYSSIETLISKFNDSSREDTNIPLGGFRQACLTIPYNLALYPVTSILTYATIDNISEGKWGMVILPIITNLVSFGYEMYRLRGKSKEE